MATRVGGAAARVIVSPDDAGPTGVMVLPVRSSGAADGGRVTVLPGRGDGGAVVLPVSVSGCTETARTRAVRSSTSVAAVDVTGSTAGVAAGTARLAKL